MSGRVTHYEAVEQSSRVSLMQTCFLSVLQETTVVSIVAAVVFLGAYGNALHQLRLLNSARTAHASRASSAGTAATYTVKEAIAGTNSKPVVTFKDFLREALPVALVHSQALAVSVVFSGFAHGATNGMLLENSDNGASKKPLPK